MERRSDSMLFQRRHASNGKRRPITFSTESRSFTRTSSGADIGQRDVPQGSVPMPSRSLRSGPTARPSLDPVPGRERAQFSAQRRTRTGALARIPGAPPRFDYGPGEHGSVFTAKSRCGRIRLSQHSAAVELDWTVRRVGGRRDKPRIFLGVLCCDCPVRARAMIVARSFAVTRRGSGRRPCRPRRWRLRVGHTRRAPVRPVRARRRLSPRWPSLPSR
jgi:hypothetical protein